MLERGIIKAWVCQICGNYYPGPDGEKEALECFNSHEELIFTPRHVLGKRFPIEIEVHLVKGKEIIDSMIYISKGEVK